jgi:hypothetical protein
MLPDDNSPRRPDYLRHINSRTGWTTGIAIILILIGIIFFLDGRGTSTNVGENPPNPATQSEHSTR